ncbi:MAG: type I-MYXAN CRISPR-associated protein Cas6/Cmx6 [Gammaproteobacteria bacterium]|nr:type I-MYXAN CRISPR-associated protein Cas6/Cmx6 [Gammaproteobacteria bacterium]
MYWNETKSNQDQNIPEDIIDLVFNIQCRSLPVDHAWALSAALLRELPWLAQETGAGVHPLHISEMGNGWMRPENPDDILHLSRRTRLILRLPKEREADANTLVGKTLDVAGNAMEVLKVNRRALSNITTVFSRYVVSEDDETVFMDNVVAQLAQIGIRPHKMLPGKKRIIRTPERSLTTRSLMVAELDVKDSVKLQQVGLGPFRHLGCGLFVPHKDIAEVSPEQTM